MSTDTEQHQQNTGTLFIVSTPIGNLKDITLRALETLQQVDEIICEDSRRTALLLNNFEIKKPLTVLNDYNESKMFSVILQKLINGQNLALVSDAGTPLVSDPGYKLVRESIVQNIPVDSIPGPSAVITALTLSGFPPDKFLFLGYLPEKPGKRTQLLKSLSSIERNLTVTYIAFISPYKLITTLKDMLEVYGDIEVVLAKELTKIYQNVQKMPITKWLETIKNPKGEYVCLFRLSVD